MYTTLLYTTITVKTIFEWMSSIRAYNTFSKFKEELKNEWTK